MTPSGVYMIPTCGREYLHGFNADPFASPVAGNATAHADSTRRWIFPPGDPLPYPLAHAEINFARAGRHYWKWSRWLK